VALKAGLITGIKTRLDVERELISMVGEDESDGSFRSISDEDYARIVHAQKKVTGGRSRRIGVIVAEGEILDGDQPPGTIGGESTARLIRNARMDDNVRAVVLRVDSPGGSVTASEQIYQELKALKAAGKPLVVSMANYAASGGYYISAPADEIWASPATITGSIGIFAIVPTVPRTLGKVGVNVDGVGTTPLSGQLRLDRPLGAPARALLQSTVERGYEEFLQRVASGRKKTRDQVDEIGQGRVWAGIDGKRLGLVDELGSFDDAVKAAARRAKLTNYDVHFIEPELTWTEELAMQLHSQLARLMFRADGNARALARVVGELDPLAREVERLSHFTARDRLYAYCFCGVP
jgi:protease-4